MKGDRPRGHSDPGPLPSARPRPPAAASFCRRQALLPGFRSCPARRGDAPSSDELTAKAVAFLRPRQDADGGWSARAQEPGITALVVTALLRSKRVTPDRPGGRQGAGLPRRASSAPTAGWPRAPHANYVTSIALMAFHEANVKGRYDRADQGRPGVPQGDAVGRGRGQDAGRRLLRRGRLRRDQQPARPVEHLVLPGGPARHRPARRRPGVEEGRWCSSRGARTSRASSTTSPGPTRSTTAASSTPPPTAASSMAGKPTTPTAASALTRSMTYAGLKSMIYAGLSPDDPRVKAAVDYIKKHYTSTRTPASASRASTTTTRPSPRPSPCSASRPSWTPPASPTTGAPS